MWPRSRLAGATKAEVAKTAQVGSQVAMWPRSTACLYSNKRRSAGVLRPGLYLVYLVEAQGKLADKLADKKYMGLVKKKRNALVRRVVEKVRAEEVCAGARCV